MARDGDQLMLPLEEAVPERPEQIGSSSVEYAPARSILTASSDEAVRKVFEPGCASIERRLQAIAQVQQSGIATCITLTPLLPIAAPADFAERLRATGVERFVTQYLHAERGQFVARTRAAAVALCQERGWDAAAS